MIAAMFFLPLQSYFCRWADRGQKGLGL